MFVGLWLCGFESLFVSERTSHRSSLFEVLERLVTLIPCGKER